MRKDIEKFLTGSIDWDASDIKVTFVDPKDSPAALPGATESAFRFSYTSLARIHFDATGKIVGHFPLDDSGAAALRALEGP